MKRTEINNNVENFYFMIKTIARAEKARRKAERISAAQYAMMLRTASTMPSFALIMKPKIVPAHRSVQPTYDVMGEYIRFMAADADAALAEFAAMRQAGRETGKGYSVVRRWFLEQYPDFSEFPLGSCIA